MGKFRFTRLSPLLEIRVIDRGTEGIEYQGGLSSEPTPEVLIQASWTVMNRKQQLSSPPQSPSLSPQRRHQPKQSSKTSSLPRHSLSLSTRLASETKPFSKENNDQKSSPEQSSNLSCLDVETKPSSKEKNDQQISPQRSSENLSPLDVETKPSSNDKTNQQLSPQQSPYVYPPLDVEMKPSAKDENDQLLSPLQSPTLYPRLDGELQPSPLQSLSLSPRLIFESKQHTNATPSIFQPSTTPLTHSPVLSEREAPADTLADQTSSPQRSPHSLKRARTVSAEYQAAIITPKKLRVESYTETYSTDYFYQSTDDRENDAWAYAKDLDKRRGLDPSDTVVKRKVHIDNMDSSETFEHTNTKQKLQELLLEEGQYHLQDLAMRSFLECLYGKVGYIPKYRRPENKQPQPPAPRTPSGFQQSSAKKVSRRVNHTKNIPSTTYKSPYDLVKDHATEIGILNSEVMFLAGHGSMYNTLNQAHHSFSIRTAAVHLERRARRFTSESRKNTYLKAWRYVTGYPSYADAYNNANETRFLTDDGVQKGEVTEVADVEYKDFVREMRMLGAKV